MLKSPSALETSCSNPRRALSLRWNAGWLIWTIAFGRQSARETNRAAAARSGRARVRAK